MRLIPRSLGEILQPTPTPFTKRDSPGACHGMGCLSVPPAAAPTTQCSGDVCGVKANRGAPTVTVTLTITISVKDTIYSTSWMTAYDTIVSTVQVNNTIMVTETHTQTKTEIMNFTSTAKVTATSDISLTDMLTATQTLETKGTASPAVLQQEKAALHPGDILAIVLGVLLLIMGVGMFLVRRRFLQKHREQRVEKKRLKTEAVELKEPVADNAADGFGTGKGIIEGKMADRGDEEWWEQGGKSF